MWHVCPTAFGCVGSAVVVKRRCWEELLLLLHWHVEKALSVVCGVLPDVFIIINLIGGRLSERLVLGHVAIDDVTEILPSFLSLRRITV